MKIFFTKSLLISSLVMFSSISLASTSIYIVSHKNSHTAPLSSVVISDCEGRVIDSSHTNTRDSGGNAVTLYEVKESQIHWEFGKRSNSRYPICVEYDGEAGQAVIRKGNKNMVKIF